MGEKQKLFITSYDDDLMILVLNALDMTLINSHMLFTRMNVMLRYTVVCF